MGWLRLWNWHLQAPRDYLKHVLVFQSLHGSAPEFYHARQIYSVNSGHCDLLRLHTLFFFLCKNLFYENAEVGIGQNFKNKPKNIPG